MSEGTEIPVPGVNSMDHTADVAIEVTADDPPDLFRRAALGMMYLLLERIPEEASGTRRLEFASSDLPGLLREWLRELLYWHATEGFSVASCQIEIDMPVDDAADDAADERPDRESDDEGRTRLEATVRGGFEGGEPVREIKGVTLHGLTAEPREDGWFGRVIFDV